MSRAIKFRVWRDGHQVEWASFVHHSCIGINEIFEQKDFVFEQFTGLLDRNGCEIYEGDIIKTPDNRLCLVEHGEHQDDDGNPICGWYLSWTQVFPQWGHIKPYRSTSSLWMPQTVSEVLGNRHQNPELLQPTKT